MKSLVAYVLAIAIVAVVGWQMSLRPSNHRDWADDVSRELIARVEGDKVVLADVRNFDWRSETDYTKRWESREYSLAKLASADLILSYWMGPAIAHTLIAFNFSDGQRVVFSMEIRRERTEQFSAIAGFFRQYEEVIVAADERDIVRVRTNVRGEDDYLYHLSIEPALLRRAFLAYIARARSLETTPAFYNTLTSNCTTILFELARVIEPDLPLDWRLLASGYFAEYAYDHGGLVKGVGFETLKEAGHFTERAKSADRQANFSEAIRAGVPGW